MLRTIPKRFTTTTQRTRSNAVKLPSRYCQTAHASPDVKYEHIETDGVPIKMWTKGVEVDPKALQQVKNIASLPFIHNHVALMPDVHFGIGATIGSVIPSKSAIIPAAVGVDIGCGMCAVQTSMTASDLPDSLREMRLALEAAIPHGRTANGKTGVDEGGWRNDIPEYTQRTWGSKLADGYNKLKARHPKIASGNFVTQLGTLGTGNHFVEICLDEADRVWLMLHSGSRGVGNGIGRYFIELAKNDMRTHIRNLPNKDLAYFNEGTKHFDDYVEAVEWAQMYASTNREIMMNNMIDALQNLNNLPPFTTVKKAVNCHHNYVNRENHFGEDVWLTRKGAVSAQKGQLGIIPGSMGAKSFIVEGLGNADSFHTCSHGAGRVLSRTAAKKKFSIEDHVKATEGVECRKDASVIDETPAAYKDIDAVIDAQSDLIKVLHTLKQIVCVKG